MPCDRPNHVGGYVRDSAGRPVPDAKVMFYGIARNTDVNGCFYFGGVLAAPGFRIEVSKDGFKQYVEGRPFALYEINIVLENEASVIASHATWRKLTVDEIGSSPLCQ